MVSHDTFNSNERWHSIIVVPVSTSTRQMGRGPTAVMLLGFDALPSESCALCHQVTTLDRAKLDTLIGQLPPLLLQSVETGMRLALSLTL